MKLEVPEGCKEFVGIDHQMLKKAKIVADDIQIGYLNSLLEKKILVREGRCPHDRSDVAARPKHQTSEGFQGMIVEWICTCCDQLVEPENFILKPKRSA